LLSALAALATLHPRRDCRATLLVQLPGASEALQDEIAQVVRILAERHPFIEKVESIGDGELRRMSDRQLRQRLGESFAEFYYAHDAVGAIGRRLAGLYAGARKICIGDAFGMIYTPESLPAPGASVRTFARKLATALALRRTPRPIAPDVAALVLPVDVSGRGLADVE